MQAGPEIRSRRADLTSIHSADYQFFVSRLREARHRAGFTQAAAGRSLGQRQSYISKCESGERRVDIVELAAFARLYDRPLAFFLPHSLANKRRLSSR
jgi:transcriptional regulator with XRE-family HTH domain